MSDEELRALERRWRESGAVEDGAAWLAGRQRVGQLDSAALELLAHLGHEPARLVLGVVSDCLPNAFYARASHELRGRAQVELHGSPERFVLRWREPTLLGADFAPCAREVFAWGARVVALDLSQVGYLNESALAELLSFSTLLREQREGVLGFLDASQDVVNMIDLIGLRQLFTWLSSLDELATLTPATRNAQPRDAPVHRYRADMDWLLGLARWGKIPCLRAACFVAELESGSAPPGFAALEAYLGAPGPSERATLERVAQLSEGWTQIALRAPLQDACWASFPTPYRLPCPRSVLSERLIEWALT